jgi:endoglucanase
MKNLCIILVSALFLISCGQISDNAVSKHGQLSVEGTSMVDEHGEKVMLKGVSYGWHNWWPRFYNEETVKVFAEDWECTVVRAAMGVGPDSGYTDKPIWSQDLIESVVKGAIANDIYVIIDWHSHHIFQDEAVEFFSNMAEKYGESPNIIYEIYNEPVHDTWEEVKAYSIEVIKAIREYDPDNIILVGSPHWDQDVHIAADDPITAYDNLMYTLHFYAGTHGQYLRDRGDYAMEKGLPLFVSESAGMEANGDGPVAYEEWNSWIEWMVENKISWVSWSIADKDESCSMLKKNASSEGPWSEEEMKETGNKTRELLKELEI